MYFKSKIQVVIYFLIFSYSFGQNDCDCNFKDFEEKINLINERDSLEVFKFANEIKKVQSDACIFKALELEFMLYLKQMKLNEAFEIIIKLEDFLNRGICQNQFIHNIYLDKALYHRATNNFEKLSEFAFKSLKEAERLQDPQKEIKSIKQIVHLFTRMNEDDKNWAYIKRAQKLIFEHQDVISSIKNYRWLAFEYEKKYTTTGRKSLIDSGFVFAKHSKMGALKYKMYDELAQSYRALEAYSYHKRDINNALKYIDSGIYYAKKINGKRNLSGLYLSKAWDHLDLGENENAVKWMDTALSEMKTNDLVGDMMVHYDASGLYEQAGRIDKAYSSFKTYATMKDSIMNTERTEVINELETKYKTELKDAQIKRLVVLLIVAASLIVLILFIATMIQLKRTKQKNKALKIAFDKQVTLEKELTRVRDNIAQDFHDDLGNRLARISLLSNLVNKEVSEKDEKIKLKVKQITDDSNELYAGTRDFIFSLKSNSDSLVELATYLSDFGQDYFSKTNIKFVLENNIREDKKLPYYWSKQLVYIFKEAITNALKYSKCNEVVLRFQHENKVLVIECVDNGVGISVKDLQSNNGLLNMRNRAEKIDGELIIKSENNKGATICFKGRTS